MIKLRLLLVIIVDLFMGMTGLAWGQHNAATFPTEAQTLSPQALQERLAGKRFTTRYANGMTATMSYGADQAIQMDLSSGLSARGRWRVDGSQVCFQFQSVPSGCSEVRATASLVYMLRYTSPEVIALEEITATAQATYIAATPSQSRAEGTPAFHYINIDTGRTQGLFTKEPVYQRAIMLAKPKPDSDVALLHFRGWPGIWRFDEKTDARFTSPRGQSTRDVYAKAGITFVMMDCPTDQWGFEVKPGSFVSGPPPSCLDNYRQSKQHADDVRKVMQVLREQHGIRHFYIQGHSMGTLSSRWLAKHLGSEIAGAIHSASMNPPPQARYGYSVSGFDYASLVSPQLFVHHESDACIGTPYAVVKAYAGQNLVTVRGGIAQGDPCGGGHLHSFEGRDAEVAQAIADWIVHRKVEPIVGQ